MAQLICEDLVLGYGGREIVRDLSFSVEAGEHLCILGENGSGKTTLMKTILGLQPPLGGRIRTGDGLSQGEIGYLPQQSAAQRDFPASVREIVLSGCRPGGMRPFYRAEDRRRAQENMERMGIGALADVCYRELSGGQQQRVLLARALCATRKMLLLDEPTAGLDPKVTSDMYRLIESLNRDDGVTILMISHDVDAALRYADHILHMDKMVFFGTKEEYLRAAGED